MSNIGANATIPIPKKMIPINQIRISGNKQIKEASGNRSNIPVSKATRYFPHTGNQRKKDIARIFIQDAIKAQVNQAVGREKNGIIKFSEKASIMSIIKRMAITVRLNIYCVARRKMSMQTAYRHKVA